MAKRAKTTRIKGANDADRQNIALAKAANKADGEPVRVTQRSQDTPEAQPSPKEQREAAQKLFEKADEAGKAELIQEASLSRAVRG